MEKIAGTTKEIRRLWACFGLLMLFTIIFSVINESERLRLSREFREFKSEINLEKTINEMRIDLLMDIERYRAINHKCHTSPQASL